MNDNRGDNRSRVSSDVIDAIREVVMICRHFVNNPEEVMVDIETRGYSVLVDLRTNPNDVGQVIGRNAHLMSSLRSFLAAISGKNGVTIILDYVTEEDNQRGQPSAQGNSRRSRYSG